MTGVQTSAGDGGGIFELIKQVAQSLVEDCGYALFSLWVNALGGSALVPRALRIIMLRVAGIGIGRAQVYPGVRFKTPRVRFGSDAMVNTGVRFDNSALVTLGRKVRVGPEVLFCTSSHRIGHSAMRAAERFDAPIIIHDGAWIGARALILPGVVVGEGAVVAAGAVVTKDVRPHSLVAGVPARTIKWLENDSIP